MSFLAFIVGMLAMTMVGWTALRAIERDSPVLFPLERWICGFALGGTLSMFAVFLLEAYAGMPLTWWSMLGTEGVLALAFGAVAWRHRKVGIAAPVEIPKPLRGLRVAAYFIFGWALLKIVAGGFLLVTTPSYFDDTMDNWNYRAKVFVEQQAIVLKLPSETDSRGISSYPPAVPLLKTELILLNAGRWSEGLANIPHAFWLLACGGTIWFLLRRRLGSAWAFFGTGIYWSLPLVLMHGVNAYADVFLSLHYVCAVHFLLIALAADSPNRIRSALVLAALPIALLPFVKNEGFALYTPSLLLAAGLTAWFLRRSGNVTGKTLLSAGMIAAAFLCVVLLGWIGYKFGHGLTFGNAKGISGMDISWQPNVLLAVGVNTFLEGNWLLLFPFLLMLLAWNARTLRSEDTILVPLTAVAIPYGLQLLLFMMTSLSTEAIMQTGYARGLIHLMPVIVIVTTLLLHKTAKNLLTE